MCFKPIVERRRCITCEGIEIGFTWTLDIKNHRDRVHAECPKCGKKMELCVPEKKPRVVTICDFCKRGRGSHCDKCGVYTMPLSENLFEPVDGGIGA